MDGRPGATSTDWERAAAELQRQPTRWGSLSWVAARPLIASVNDALARHSGGLVTQLREHWVPTPPPVVEAADVTTFFVVGDTGEQDGSQYVVAPAISAAARQHEPGFVVLMSDVIYPAGDVEDYADAVYRPYRQTGNPDFDVPVPLLALPGNHDWYDGLAGFMFHFAGRPQPPVAAYAPDSAWYAPSRLCRILWRRAQRPKPEIERAAAGSPLAGALGQPGPYYAIRTRDVLVVCIDTGIDGTIDAAQWAWLDDISHRERGPKLLLTGKPLLVNGQRNECWVDREPPDALRSTSPSVWKLVNDPECEYVATVGGDVHNFQQYAGTEPGGPSWHLVSGGGGAFMHSTHSLVVAPHDSRRYHDTLPEEQPRPRMTFPSPGASLDFFAKLLIPSVRRLARNVLCLILGTAVATFLLTLAGAPEERGWLIHVPAHVLAAWLIGVGALALAVFTLLRASWREKARTDVRLRRLLSWTIGVVGFVALATAYRLQGEYFVACAVFWVGAMLYHAELNRLLRRSGWWRPADEFARNVGHGVFGIGLLSLAAIGLALQVAMQPLTGKPVSWTLPLVSTALLVGVGLVGRILRRYRLTAWRAGRWVDIRSELPEAELERRTRANARWHRIGLAVGGMTQAAWFVLAGVILMRGIAQPAVLLIPLIGTIILGLVLLVAAVALLLVTELVAAVLQGVGRASSRAIGWGRAAGITHWLTFPLIVVTMVAAVVLVQHQAGFFWRWAFLLRPSLGLPVVLVGTVSVLFGTDWLRRRYQSGYLWLMLGALGLLAVAASGLTATSYGWLIRGGLVTAVLVLAVGVALVVGHLSFLNAYLLLDKSVRGTPSFTAEQLETLFAARSAFPPKDPRDLDLPRNVRIWARLTAPSIGEPNGLLQRGVAEIYSSDEPPFFKSFLRIDTHDGIDGPQLDLTLHRVFGDQPSDTVPVGSCALGSSAHRGLSQELVE